MALPKKYDFREWEARLRKRWEEEGVHRFEPGDGQEIYAIDTPPPTVSGKLHMGHVYSYSHADFMARFWRMNGKAVFYPMGFDDNGLPTEHLVEREVGKRAEEMGREEFVGHCLRVGEQAGEEYRALWQALGLSVDWRHTYRTIGGRAQRLAQWSFLDLHRKGLVYRQEAPVLWCVRCGTALAQAELEERRRESLFYELVFGLEDGGSLRLATTRPELLPSCAAIFVHPEDERYRHLVGKSVRLPLEGRQVPVLADEEAEPEKGTGAVMCCTFGDAADVAWWRRHGLPLRGIMGQDGKMAALAGRYAGLSVEEARAQIVRDLEEAGMPVDNRRTAQVVRVHERCGTPVEYLVTSQWFVRVLDFREELGEAGRKLVWHPPHMKAKYLQWLETVSWDWCISRQRPFGVPFPVWHCRSCGEVRLAAEEALPMDPARQLPNTPCVCTQDTWKPDSDVMDTWATSALTPQIAGGWGEGEGLYERVFPMSIRPLAHEIIRTWAFYSIVMAHHHWGCLPWKELVVSGWGLMPQGQGKISKSRGGGPAGPPQMLERYPADALRYWAASTGLGKDSIISEEKIQAGDKLLTKLWNVARFAEQFLVDYLPPPTIPPLSPADAWILARLQRLVEEATTCLNAYDYARAKSLAEVFFWHDLADNYLEMAKKRLYAEGSQGRAGVLFALYTVLKTTTKLLAPFLPYVTDAVYRSLFASESVHGSSWPQVDGRLVCEEAEQRGEKIIAIATAVRRYKSETNLTLGSELTCLQVVADDAGELQGAEEDVASLTRAQRVEFRTVPDPELEIAARAGDMRLAIVGPAPRKAEDESGEPQGVR